MRMAAPETRGVRVATHASLMATRVTMLSVASSTRSASSTAVVSVSPSSRRWTGRTATFEFSAATRSAADRTLDRPTVASPWAI